MPAATDPVGLAHNVCARLDNLLAGYLEENVCFKMVKNFGGL
jgi:hypothetical protein